MKEELLHYIWKFQKFSKKQLYTTDGEAIIVLDPGKHNHYAGPDFIEAKVKIGSTEWYGNIEIHSQSSQWFKHNHHNDSNYNNVILHVVWQHDLDQFHRPTLTLQERVSTFLLSKYERLMKSKTLIACQDYLPVLTKFEWNQWMNRLVIERLEIKTQRIRNSLNENQNNWQKTFYEQMAYSYGLTTNEDAMLELAKRVPLRLLAKHKHQIHQLESILFGIAGLLPKQAKDNYSQLLLKEFQFLNQKYKLQAMHTENWNFGGIRPATFPTIRIAQFASLISKSHTLFSQVMKPLPKQKLQELLHISASNYWNTHYTFGKTSKEKIKMLGAVKKSNLIINTIIPFQFIYGSEMNNDLLINHTLNMLEHIEKEKNNITQFFEQRGVCNNSAYHSQAIIHLFKEYCRPKHCLDCRVANSYLNKND